jgi:hypothetical protein
MPASPLAEVRRRLIAERDRLVSDPNAVVDLDALEQVIVTQRDRLLAEADALKAQAASRTADRLAAGLPERRDATKDRRAGVR